MRLYLDNCCFNRPFDDQTQTRIRLEAEAKLAIQEEIRNGKLELGWSYILDFENAANPFEERRATISHWRGLASGDVSESDAIIDRANGFHRIGFKKKDSLHLACAIEAHCDVFLTTDDGILMRRDSIKEIEVLNPVEYFTRHDD